MTDYRCIVGRDGVRRISFLANYRSKIVMMSARENAKRGIDFLFGRHAAWVYATQLCWRAPRAWRKKPELQLVPRLIRGGDQVIDVGANGADWTLAMSRQVGSTGRVYAFEADPFYADVTTKTLLLMRARNVAFFRCGLSDRTGPAELLIRNEEDERMAGTSRILAGSGAETLGRTVAIHLERLDDVAATHPGLWSARFMKCDVEGHELMVFRGAEKVLMRARPIVCFEVGIAHLHGYQEQDTYRFFEALGYRRYELSFEGRHLRMKTVPILDRADGHLDVVMAPEEQDMSDALEIAGA